MVLRSVYIFLTLLVLASCSNQSNEAGENVAVEPSGQELYGNSCAACHGSDGKLGAGGASDLSVSTLKKEEAKDVILNGRGAMQSQNFVFENDDEVDAVVEYLEELRK